MPTTLIVDGVQLSRRLVVGQTADTVRLGRNRFLGGNWIRAFLSPLGSRRGYSLPGSWCRRVRT